MSARLGYKFADGLRVVRIDGFNLLNETVAPDRLLLRLAAGGRAGGGTATTSTSIRSSRWLFASPWRRPSDEACRRVQHGLDHGMAEQPGLGMHHRAVAADHARQRDHVGVVRRPQHRDVEMRER